MSERRKVLTDVSQGIWEDQSTLSSTDGPQLSGSPQWSINKRTLRGGMSDGIDVVDIDNGLFQISVLPTRGMGLWRGECAGVKLGWNSPVKHPVHPKMMDLQDRNGLGWLGGFNELLCRCGLSSHGAPGLDIEQHADGSKTETPLTLHGKIANLPAHTVEMGVDETDAGKLWVRGVIDETSLYGPCLQLSSTLETTAGSNRILIRDTVTNLAAHANQFELLYHTNIGAPFLEEGSQFSVPFRSVAPRDEHAASDIGHWQTFRGPTTGYVEQCYFVEVAADEQGETVNLLRNAAGNLGISMRYRTEQLPWFTLWKNTQAEADGFCVGIEPGTSFPNLRSFERDQGRVIHLEPGATYQTELEISVLTSAKDVQNIEADIERRQARCQPVVHADSQSNWSPAD